MINLQTTYDLENVQVEEESTARDLNEIANRMKPEIESYVRIQRELDQIKQNVHELTQQKKILEDTIMKCMQDNGLFEIKANDGSIRLEEKSVPSSLNKDMIKQCIAERVDLDLAESLTDSMFKNRPMNPKLSLKIKGVASRSRRTRN